MDFTQAKSKDGEYAQQGEGTIDYSAKNILNCIDKFNKSVSGTRFVYETLCEFLHYNVGDLLATTLYANTITDHFGTRLLTREIGVGTRSFDVQPDLDRIMGKVCPIFVKIMESVPPAHLAIEGFHKEAMRRTQVFMRKALRKQKHLFGRTELCPCMSGQTVSKCCGRYPTH